MAAGTPSDEIHRRQRFRVRRGDLNCLEPETWLIDTVSFPSIFLKDLKSWHNLIKDFTHMSTIGSRSIYGNDCSSKSTKTWDMCKSVYFHELLLCTS